MQLINEARPQVLVYRIHPATNAHVLSIGGLARLVERLMDAAGDEVKRRAAFHLGRWAHVMRPQDTHRM